MKLKKKSMFLVFLVGAIITISLTACDSASLERLQKTNDSDQNGGLDRILTVYSNDGKQLAQYEGKFDIEENDAGTKVLFDLNGKRTIIYNAIVIAQEK